MGIFNKKNDNVDKKNDNVDTKYLMDMIDKLNESIKELHTRIDDFEQKINVEKTQDVEESEELKKIRHNQKVEEEMTKLKQEVQLKREQETVFSDYQLPNFLAGGVLNLNQLLLILILYTKKLKLC